MAIAVGGCIDDHLDAFTTGRCAAQACLRCAAILRAQIDSGIRRSPAARYVSEFAGIIRGEKDIVMLQIKARGARMGKPHERGQ